MLARVVAAVVVASGWAVASRWGRGGALSLSYRPSVQPGQCNVIPAAALLTWQGPNSLADLKLALLAMGYLLFALCT